MVAFNPVLWRAFDPDGNAHDYCRRPENVAAEVAWATADGRATIHHGDCLDVMRTMADGLVDAVVTDPPYGLAFMGKAWDHGVPGAAFWIEALRVAKPGAHLLAFGGTRTFHRLACAIEDAGWEIRDCLSWLYGSGFPKSHNGAWGGTALKPAWEPVIMARKPLIGTVAANHAAHGTGALNIDGCRIATTDTYAYPNGPGGNVAPTSLGMRKDGTSSLRRETPVESNPLGRWPANVALDEDAAAALDEQSAACRSAYPGNEDAATRYAGTAVDASRIVVKNAPGNIAGLSYSDAGGASRFFYTSKASRGEREAGLDGFRETTQAERTGREPGSAGLHTTVRPNVEGGNPYANGGSGTRRNTHPTVKPVDLMRWLVRLVTPMGGTVLDPFLGSGTTLVAALQEGCKGVGIEREAAYVEIAKARVAHEAAQGSLFK